MNDDILTVIETAVNYFTGAGPDLTVKLKEIFEGKREAKDIHQQLFISTLKRIEQKLMKGE